MEDGSGQKREENPRLSRRGWACMFKPGCTRKADTHLLHGLKPGSSEGSPAQTNKHTLPEAIKPQTKRCSHPLNLRAAAEPSGGST